MFRELRLINECIKNNDEKKLYELCNIYKKEERYLEHLLHIRGREDLIEKYRKNKKSFED